MPGYIVKVDGKTRLYITGQTWPDLYHDLSKRYKKVELLGEVVKDKDGHWKDIWFFEERGGGE